MENKFKECLLNYNSFTGFKISGTEFFKGSLKDYDFSNSIAKSCSYQSSDLNGSNFNNTDLSKSDLRCAENDLTNPLFTQFKIAKFSNPEVLSLLSLLEILLE